MQNEMSTSSVILPSPPDIVNNSINNNIAQDSILSYFWDASLLIKVVILTLLAASIYSWAIIISKYFTLRRINKEADDFEESFWSGTPLDVLYKQLRNSTFDPMSNIFCAAMAELEQYNAMHSNNNNVIPRVERAMRIAIQKEINELEKGLSFLSTVGTNGVIVGLLGTVIGISNGFKIIAAQQSASISTVGPVISEALFTTAFGVLTAIPAAVAYNKYIDSVNRYINRLEIFSDEFVSIITRQYDED
ncbi:MAG: protein TolQ [Alphaproteobacteria bacterium]|nr:protein TolQ [Alphaproteobacteria bacterium]